MKYRYALFTVAIQRGLRRLVVVDDTVYRQHLAMDSQDEYENYDFIGIIESDLKADELLDTIYEAGESKAEYYRNSLLNIARILRETNL